MTRRSTNPLPRADERGTRRSAEIRSHAESKKQLREQLENSAGARGRRL